MSGTSFIQSVGVMKKKEVLEEELQATQDDNTSSGPELI